MISEVTLCFKHIVAFHAVGCKQKICFHVTDEIFYSINPHP